MTEFVAEQETEYQQEMQKLLNQNQKQTTTIWSQSQRCLEMEYVAKQEIHQKTLRPPYQNWDQIMTNQRQTQNTLDIKNIMEPFRTHVSAPRNDC